jgi:hypothetical protein
MHPDQLALAELAVALVDALARAAVADKVLGGRGDVAALHRRAARRITLQPVHHLGCVAPYQRRILRVAFVAAAPAQVLRHRQRRRECPVHPHCDHFLRRGSADAADQRRVMRRTESDVVREDGRTGDAGVAVHRVDAEQQRDHRVSGPRFD